MPWPRLARKYSTQSAVAAGIATARYRSGRNASEADDVPGSIGEQLPVKEISSRVTEVLEAAQTREFKSFLLSLSRTVAPRFPRSLPTVMRSPQSLVSSLKLLRCVV